MEGTKLIQLEDGTLVEVEVQPGEARPISGGLADKVNAAFDKIQPVLVKTCRPILAACQEIGREVAVAQAEIELGLSFEGEGNIYITKTKASANLSVKFVLKPNG